MSIKNLAVQAATAKQQYEYEQAQIAAETRRLTFERRSREVTKQVLGVEPDVVISSSDGHKNYVQVEDMWFAVDERGYYMSPRPQEDYDRVVLIPVLRCVNDPSDFHPVNLGYTPGVESLAQLGKILQDFPVEKWKVPYYYNKCECPK